MLKSGAEQLQTVQEMASTASDALNTANKSFSEFQKVNSVLGSPISSRVLNRLRDLQGMTDGYDDLLFDLSNEHGDAAEGINRFSRNQLGTQDRGDLLRAKSYFQEKFFTDSKKKTLNLKQAQQITYERESSAKDSVITTLALSKKHKADLKKDHESLSSIVKSSNDSAEMNHQALIQTKLLARIAQNLEKLILLQSQQLDFMAKTYMEHRGIGLGEARSAP